MRSVQPVVSTERDTAAMRPSGGVPPPRARMTVKARMGDRPELRFPEAPLTDGDVRLRPSCDADAAAERAWGRDSQILRWAHFPADGTEQEIRARDDVREQERRAGRGVYFTIAAAASDEVLGACNLRIHTEDPRIAELGYVLAPAARGRGVATRAVALLVSWGFDTLELEQIQAFVHPDNRRSVGVVERLGFHRDGLLPAYRERNGGREDRVRYSLLPGELVQPSVPGTGTGTSTPRDLEDGSLEPSSIARGQRTSEVHRALAEPAAGTEIQPHGRRIAVVAAPDRCALTTANQIVAQPTMIDADCAQAGRRRHYLMCPPDHFEVAYSINPWMDPRVTVDRDRANAQWEELRAVYLALGHVVDVLPPTPGLPDMVFTANGAMVLDGCVLVARFRHPERAAEAEAHEKWFRAHGYSEVQVSRFVAEGQGDYLIAGQSLLAGAGFRTDRRSHAQAEELCGRRPISLTLVDSRYYHLDTALAVLDDEQIMYYPNAFSAESRATLAELFPNAILAGHADAEVLGLNAVSDGQNVVLPSGATELAAQLRSAGFHPIGVDVSELLKAGGGVKCCTLELGAQTGWHRPPVHLEFDG
jgi:N-dimethylarginine dimethylaminohydrolase/RimJ/RimL family protein N-acetyltransferase